MVVSINSTSPERSHSALVQEQVISLYQFPLIQLPRREATGAVGETALNYIVKGFPLIQLPRREATLGRLGT